MEKSDWIALGALFVAILGLIPQFYQTFDIGKSTKQKKKKKKNIPNENSTADSNEVNNQKEMPTMMRMLMLVIFAFASFLIEIIMFSSIAHLFDVDVNLTTMSLVWKITFFLLFLIPGVFLFLSFLVFVGNTKD